MQDFKQEQSEHVYRGDVCPAHLSPFTSFNITLLNTGQQAFGAA